MPEHDHIFWIYIMVWNFVIGTFAVSFVVWYLTRLWLMRKDMPQGVWCPWLPMANGEKKGD